MQSAGMDRFIYDPDKITTLRLLQEHLRTLPEVGHPQLDTWCDNMDLLPQKFSYRSIVEYLVNRQIKMLQVSDTTENLTVPMPTADKPLVKRYNFFASGHVGEILLNRDSSVLHVRTTVLASMKETRYSVSCALDDTTGLVIQATCQCVAGALGKCNHIAGLLFSLVDYVTTMRRPDCCTNRPQQ